jgi:hypothetical protein
MSIRQKLNDNPALGVGITAVIIVIALIIIWTQVSGGNGTELVSEKAFYTLDDGKTYFKDDMDKAVPFDKDGQKALRAFVYKCGDGEPFVGIVGRHTSVGQKEMADYLAGMKAKDTDRAIRLGIDSRTMEIRRVADKRWMPYDESAIEGVKCPSGEQATAVNP